MSPSSTEFTQLGRLHVPRGVLGALSLSLLHGLRPVVVTRAKPRISGYHGLLREEKRRKKKREREEKRGRERRER